MTQCLNCDGVTTENFCCRCGQKVDTHRITIRHFISHHLLHGVWHLEKGIFFTLKEAFVRPGQAALDYIGGKRVRYYNVFYLSLLLLGLNIVVVHFLQKYHLSDSLNSSDDATFDFLSTNVKFVVFALVPLLALNSLLFFPKLKLNFAEHLIIAGMCLTAIMVLSPLSYIADFLTEKFESDFFGVLEVILYLLIILFPLWTYWNVNKNVYFGWKKVFRVLLFYSFLILQILIIFFTTMYVITGAFKMKVIM